MTITPSGSNELARARALDSFQLHPGGYTPPANSAVGTESLPAGKREVTRVPLAERVYRNVVFLALPMLALLLFPSSLLPLGLLCVPLLFILRWRALASPFPHTRVNFVLLVFMLALLWGVLRAPDLSETTLTIARLLAGLVTLFVVVDYADHPGRLWNVAAALVAAGVVTAVAAPFISQVPNPKLFVASFLFHPLNSSTFTLSNPNYVAGGLAVIVPLALALILQEQRILRRVGAVGIAPIVVMLVLLQARAALIAEGLGIVLFAALYRVWLLVAVLGAGVVLVIVSTADLSEFSPQLAYIQSSLTNYPTLEGRQEAWNFGATLLVVQPLGIGVNQYSHYADGLAGDYLPQPLHVHPHNIFLQAGLDTGLVGLGAFVVLITYSLYGAWHAYRRGVKRTLALGVLAALIIAVVHGWFEISMWDNRSVVILWALFGMAIVLGRYGARRRARKA